MCHTCGDKYGSVKHQLYWFVYFLYRCDFKKSFRSLYHLFNKKAYRAWFNEYHEDKVLSVRLQKSIIDCDPPDEYIDYISSMEPLDYMNMIFILEKESNESSSLSKRTL